LEEVGDLEECVALAEDEALVEDEVFAEDAARHQSELFSKAFNRNINS
jgi:hypothetical protein